MALYYNPPPKQKRDRGLDALMHQANSDAIRAVGASKSLQVLQERFNKWYEDPTTKRLLNTPVAFRNVCYFCTLFYFVNLSAEWFWSKEIYETFGTLIASLVVYSAIILSGAWCSLCFGELTAFALNLSGQTHNLRQSGRDRAVHALYGTKTKWETFRGWLFHPVTGVLVLIGTECIIINLSLQRVAYKQAAGEATGNDWFVPAFLFLVEIAMGIPAVYAWNYGEAKRERRKREAEWSEAQDNEIELRSNVDRLFYTYMDEIRQINEARKQEGLSEVSPISPNKELLSLIHENQKSCQNIAANYKATSGTDANSNGSGRASQGEDNPPANDISELDDLINFYNEKP